MEIKARTGAKSAGKVNCLASIILTLGIDVKAAGLPLQSSMELKYPLARWGLTPKLSSSFFFFFFGDRVGWISCLNQLQFLTQTCHISRIFVSQPFPTRTEVPWPSLAAKANSTWRSCWRQVAATTLSPPLLSLRELGTQHIIPRLTKKAARRSLAFPLCLSVNWKRVVCSTVPAFTRIWPAGLVDWSTHPNPPRGSCPLGGTGRLQ